MSDRILDRTQRKTLRSLKLDVVTQGRPSGWLFRVTEARVISTRAAVALCLILAVLMLWVR